MQKSLRRSVDVNSLSGICLTKLDVLDGLEEIKICVGYESTDSGCVGSSDALAYENFEANLRNHARLV